MKRVTYYSGMSGEVLCSIPVKAIPYVLHPGDCTADAKHWLPKVTCWAKDDALRRFLKETGAWDDLDTVGPNVIKQRVLWIACGDIIENPQEYNHATGEQRSCGGDGESVLGNSD